MQFLVWELDTPVITTSLIRIKEMGEGRGEAGGSRKTQLQQVTQGLEQLGLDYLQE